MSVNNKTNREKHFICLVISVDKSYILIFYTLFFFFFLQSVEVKQLCRSHPVVQKARTLMRKNQANATCVGKTITMSKVVKNVSI